MNSTFDLQSLCRRLESAQAASNQAIALAQARMHPGAGARCERINGAFAVYLGPGHMLNQGLAIGLEGPFREEDLGMIEAVLGTPTVLEISAGADVDTYPMLARRGYRLQAFQQVWMRTLGDESPSITDGIGVVSGVCPDSRRGHCFDREQAVPPFNIDVRPITPCQADLFACVVTAGFMERDELTPEGIEIILPATQAAGITCFIAWVDEEPVAAGTVALWEGVATLSSTSVRPKFRGRGIQSALIQARLAYAKDQGCILACSVTVPHGPSQFNLQRQGFQAAYPKLEMVRD